MFSLVKFDNDEYAVMSSKRIKITKGNNCIVKYPGGAKYNADIVCTSESKTDLDDYFNMFITNGNAVSQPETQNLSDSFGYLSSSIKFSTPIRDQLNILDVNLPIIIAENEADDDRNILNDGTEDPSEITENLQLTEENWRDISSINDDSILINKSDKNYCDQTYSVSGMDENQSVNNINHTYLKNLDNGEDEMNDTSRKSVQNQDVDNHNNIERSDDATKLMDSSQNDSTYDPDSSATNMELSNKKEVSSIEVLSVSQDFCPVDIRKITVPVVASGKGTSKKHFCIFCKTLQTKLVRHLLIKHKNERQVKDFRHLPTNHLERRKAIEKLRKDGDHLHNTNEKYNTGIMITSRQRSGESQKLADDYTACPSCKGFYAKSTIRFHVRTCNTLHVKGAKNILSTGRQICGYIHAVASPKLRNEVFPILRDDEVVKCIRYDELIIKMGNKLCEKYSLAHQHDHIRAQLRLLGKLKLALLTIRNDFDDFKNIFKPENFDDVIKAMRIVGNWNADSMIYETPGTAQTITTLLKKCARKLRVEYIKFRKLKQKKEVDNFLLLWEEEIPLLINKKARQDQDEKKREKKIVLPSQNDIKKLYDFLRKESGICIDILFDAFDFPAWKHLNDCTLVSIQIFNRRRAGELERLKVVNYVNKQTLADLIDMTQYQSLSETSINFTKKFERLILRGKLGREVSILLSPYDIQCIEILLKHRTDAGVSSDNEYLFAKPAGSSKKYLRACPLMRQFANDCGAVVPSSLRGTQLRKHIATYTAFLNVKESDVDRLAHFMGHSKEIHKSIYRVPVPIAEVTTVSEMLTSAIGLNVDQDEETSDHNENSDTSDEENCANENDENHPHTQENTMDENTCVNTSVNDSRRCTSPFGKTCRRKWNENEKTAIYEHFGNLSTLNKLPSLHECKAVCRKYEALHNRTPQQLKSWIDNQRRLVIRKSRSSHEQNTGYHAKKVSFQK